LCERFHKLPKELLAEDSDFFLMLQIEAMGRPLDEQAPADL